MTSGGRLRLSRGDVVAARFPEHIPPGHEQLGRRPAVIVGLPEAAGTPRFPVVLLAPITSNYQQSWAARSPFLYPILGASVGGLPVDSIVLLDQTRALDVERVEQYLGSLPAADYARITTGFLLLFGLSPAPPNS